MLTDVDVTVGLFPGQGGYREGALASFWDEGDPVLRTVLAEVDDAAEAILGRPLSPRLFGSGGQVPDDPELLQLAVFALSVGSHELLAVRDVRFGALLGHSLGEIAALVCGGAFSVRQGTEMICHRIAATAAVTGGGMVSLGCGADQAGRILNLVADPDLVLAVINGPSQVVVSGPDSGLRRLEAVATAIDVVAIRLTAPAPFHNPLMAGVRSEVLARLDSLRGRPLHTPVYSPILGRFYRDDDDLVRLLGLHLVTAVRFDAAMERLHDAGARIFVEVGAGSTLTGLMKALHPEILVLSPLGDEKPKSSARPGEVPRPPAAMPPPRIEPAIANGDVVATVRAIYAEALEYPEEVLTEDAHLEADLGVDSVKRTELLAKVRRHYALDMPSEGARAADYGTIGAVAALVRSSLTVEAADAR